MREKGASTEKSILSLGKRAITKSISKYTSVVAKYYFKGNITVHSLLILAI